MLARFAILVALLLFSTNIFSRDLLFTEIQKSASGDWSVSYTSAVPIKSLMFAISPNDSRRTRWSPEDKVFQLNYLNGKEILTRRDNQYFNRVKFRLTPTYTHLPKHYAPFSPYSDKGMLFHSARFFACPNLCSGQENLWSLSLKVPKGEHIVLNGESHQGEISWWDKNDGRKVYVGKGAVSEYKHYIGIIDKKLPPGIREKLELLFPQMMTKLSMHYGALENKPMLFASYGHTSDGSFGRQGGTLPDQVFMHWYGPLPQQKAENEALLWFFAHEAAHMYQHLLGRARSPIDNWVHEGHADMMAKKLIQALFPQYKAYVQHRSQVAKEKCLAVAEQSSLHKEVARNNYDILYQCGLFIFDTIESFSSQSGVTEKLWQRYIQELAGAEQSPGELLISLAEKQFQLPQEDAAFFRQLISR